MDQYRIVNYERVGPASAIAQQRMTRYDRSGDSMTITIKLDPETERRLRDLAGQAGQTLERYLEQLAVQTSSTAPPCSTAAESPEDWVARFRAWVKGHRPLPVVADDSRESIYGNRGE